MSTLAPSSVSTAAGRAVSGRDRRQHGRWRIEGAYAVIGEERWPLIDVSIGGFRARRPPDAPEPGRSFAGTIVWSDGRARGTLEFRARPVRVEPGAANEGDGEEDGEGVDTLAAAFEPLDGREIDRLLALLSGIEAQRRRERGPDPGAARRRRRRLLVFILVMLFAIGILAGAWAAGFYGLLKAW